MKKQKIGWLAAVAVGSLLVSSYSSFAQDNNPRRRGGPPAIEQRLDRMEKELNLTADQKTKIKAVMEKDAKAREEVFRDSSLTREQRREKMRARAEEQDKEIKAILTPEQYQKWEKTRIQARQRRAPEAGQTRGGKQTN